jgi:hypothetical protein
MRRTGPKEIEAIVKLDGPSRFKYFIKRVVDEERAWGLWKDGWALMATSGEEQAFPLWPAREYSEMFVGGDWNGYEPEEIGLSSLLEELLPKMKARGIRPAVFPTPEGKGVTPTVDELSQALRQEMEQYE